MNSRDVGVNGWGMDNVLPRCKKIKDEPKSGLLSNQTKLTQNTRGIIQHHVVIFWTFTIIAIFTIFDEK